jgi:NEDD4-binding protein 2
MKRLIILRGLPGSGKSHLAKELVPELHAVVLSTDDFFTMGDEYRFDPARLGHAHTWNQHRCVREMFWDTRTIVIDNTNTQAWEAREYVKLAQMFSYEVEFMEPTTGWVKDPQECCNRCTHGVPLESIIKMAERYEENITVEQCLEAKAPWE